MKLITDGVNYSILTDNDDIYATSMLSMFTNLKLNPDNCKEVWDKSDKDSNDGFIPVQIVKEGKCNCRCHRNSGVRHIAACCHPGRPILDNTGCLIIKSI
jgi:hypothetical protein